jgi:hypothetical protein
MIYTTFRGAGLACNPVANAHTARVSDRMQRAHGNAALRYWRGAHMIRIELQVELTYEIDDPQGADFVFNIHAAHTPRQTSRSSRRFTPTPPPVTVTCACAACRAS